MTVFAIDDLGEADLEPLVAAVSQDYGVAPDGVRDRASALYAQYVDARIRTFVPVLVERQLRDDVRRGLLSSLNQAMV